MRRQTALDIVVSNISVRLQLYVIAGRYTQAEADQIARNAASRLSKVTADDLPKPPAQMDRNDWARVGKAILDAAEMDLKLPAPGDPGAGPVGSTSPSPPAPTAGGAGQKPPASPTVAAPGDPDPPRRVTHDKHHQNSESPEPANAQELFDNAIVDKKGVRWAIDANGTIHRFSKPRNGESHWNGSTAGNDPITMDIIPIYIRRALK
jgi:hypothetical protein